MMAFMFGMMALISFFLAVVFCIKDVDAMASRMGGAGLLAMVFAFVVFPMLPRVGFAVSVISMLLWALVIYIGITGIG